MTIFLPKTATAVMKKTATANGIYMNIPASYIDREEGEERGAQLLAGNWNTKEVVETMTAQVPKSTRGPKQDYALKAHRYYQLVMLSLLFNNRDEYQIKFNLYHIAREQIKRQLGQYTLNKKRYFWLDWFEQQRFSLYTIIKKGSNLTEENTMIKLNFEFADYREIELWTAHEILDHFTPNTYDSIQTTALDMMSLANYIIQTEENLKLLDTQDNYTRTVKHNLKYAHAIYRVAQEQNGLLAQPVKTSAFGRNYYKGLNLQNVSTLIRHAALGNCYSIDINNASQCWRVKFAQELNPQLSTIITRELIRDKDNFRGRVAKIIKTEDINRVKELLVSIGFGADINKQPWPTGLDDYELPSIRKLLFDDEIELLLADVWFMEFITEQTAMNDAIYAWAKQNKTLFGSCVKSQDGKKMIRNKMLAFLYQQSERIILDQMIDYVNNKSPNNFLLSVHDAIYIKQSIDQAEFNSWLCQHNPLMTATITRHNGYNNEPRINVPWKTYKITLPQLHMNKYANKTTLSRRFPPLRDITWQLESVVEHDSTNIKAIIVHADSEQMVFWAIKHKALYDCQALTLEDLSQHRREKSVRDMISAQSRNDMVAIAKLTGHSYLDPKKDFYDGHDDGSMSYGRE